MNEDSITKLMNHAWDINGCLRNTALDVQGSRSELARIASAVESLSKAAWVLCIWVAASAILLAMLVAT
jgi:hypothetical protein